jgi:hypothetical protein
MLEWELENNRKEYEKQLKNINNNTENQLKLKSQE